MKTPNTQEGITLLVTLLLMGVLLGISASLLNVTLKQYQLSGIGYASEIAFQAANAAMECILYHDRKTTSGGSSPGLKPFDVPNSGEQSSDVSIRCMTSGDIYEDSVSNLPSYVDPTPGNRRTRSGGGQRFTFEWGTSPTVCSEVTVYKFYSDTAAVPVMVGTTNMRTSGSCPAGSVCTVVQARGYNVACNQRSNSRVVEREYTFVY